MPRRCAYAIAARTSSADVPNAAAQASRMAAACGAIVVMPHSLATPWIGRTLPQLLQLGHCQ
uniref:Uncharacterized protein n=1 Tax=Mizugakiibacter sediminis TaxID=1475481 RepID=A0A0S6YXU7_9GAMM